MEQTGIDDSINPETHPTHTREKYWYWRTEWERFALCLYQAKITARRCDNNNLEPQLLNRVKHIIKYPMTCVANKLECIKSNYDAPSLVEEVYPLPPTIFRQFIKSILVRECFEAP